MTTPKYVYIAGPMRGIEEFNFPTFDAAEAALVDAGHVAFNPAGRDRLHGFNPTGMTGNEDLAEHGFDLRTALNDDLAWITRHADAILLLPAWQKSKGARAELNTAAALGLKAAEFRCTDWTDWRDANDILNPTASASPTEVRVTSDTGGQKGTKEARYDLIPTGPLCELATLYGKGAAKYEPRNYERGYDWSLSYAALQRHANAWWSREDNDPEMGTSHLASVAWHAFALMLFAAKHPDYDDRPEP